ncbi:hypothetical protein M446_1772 [Methylobacterium sp. 4-46]|uniref:hypothetical protein n=1 Tax=unclassified Methylobacterium TaxID=2615210 RepID=UPI000152E20C|nr:MULTISPECIES: hypothetical protein [Methylobacterium]ACA16262.1 hypothetical protein M446_1772 [Methylobacterium sp. 4-46]WFT81970.1 hypothetical protein QA634_08960 [Methylobacterium nodulans]
MRITIISLALLLSAASAEAQTLELDQRLRSCLLEQAQQTTSESRKDGEKPDLKQQAGQLLGRCGTDVGAWLYACRAERSEPDCSRGADVRAVAALQGGKGAGGDASKGGGH